MIGVAATLELPRYTLAQQIRGPTVRFAQVNLCGPFSEGVFRFKLRLPGS